MFTIVCPFLTWKLKMVSCWLLNSSKNQISLPSRHNFQHFIGCHWHSVILMPNGYIFSLFMPISHDAWITKLYPTQNRNHWHKTKQQQSISLAFFSFLNSDSTYYTIHHQNCCYLKQRAGACQGYITQTPKHKPLFIKNNGEL